jgi:hypothetical protein
MDRSSALVLILAAAIVAAAVLSGIFATWDDAADLMREPHRAAGVR